jgi:[acyl-carrier-protein] S-malonyltransferase
MAAVLGLDFGLMHQVCVEASVNGSVQCANLNAPGQIVISGTTAGVEKASALAKAAGAKKVIPLSVSVPAHSALMRFAAERFSVRISDVEFAMPAFEVIHNVDVAPSLTVEAIKDSLVRQLYSPVRWQETIELFASRGVLRCIECGPGKVLGPLVKRSASGLEVTSLIGPAEMRSALASVGCSK